jgi:hypothetical protein
VNLLSDIAGFALPIVLLPIVLAFWKRHDALGIDARKDRKSTRRRIMPRVNVNWPVSIRTVMGTVRGRIIDVNDQGAGLLSIQPLTRSEVINMTLEIPGHPVEADAEVVRCGTPARARREAPYHGIGVFFRRISQEDKAFLAALVDANISETATANIEEQEVFTFRAKAGSKVPLRRRMLTR